MSTLQYLSVGLVSSAQLLYGAMPTLLDSTDLD